MALEYGWVLLGLPSLHWICLDLEVLWPYLQLSLVRSWSVEVEHKRASVPLGFIRAFGLHLAVLLLVLRFSPYSLQNSQLTCVNQNAPEICAQAETGLFQCQVAGLVSRLVQKHNLDGTKRVSFNSANNPPMLKPCSSSSKSSIEISVALRCPIPALDHIQERTKHSQGFLIFKFKL